MSVKLPVCLSVSVCKPVYLPFIFSVRPTVCLSVCISRSLSVSLSISPSFSLSVQLSHCFSLSLSLRHSLCPSNCLSVSVCKPFFLPIILCPSNCLSFCLGLSISLSFCLSLQQTDSVRQFIRLSARLPSFYLFLRKMERLFIPESRLFPSSRMKNSDMMWLPSCSV